MLTYCLGLHLLGLIFTRDVMVNPQDRMICPMVERKQKAKDKIIYSEQIIFLSTWDSLLIALLTYLEQLHYYA